MNSVSQAIEPTVSIRGLTRRFGSETAVAPTDLDIGPGGITGLLGPNGSGKSTMLRMLIGLVHPSAGQVSVGGVQLKGEGANIRGRVSYAPGEIGVYGEWKGRDHLRWLLRGREPQALAVAIGLAERLKLPLAKKVRTYSHGMKRQMLFAAALAPDVSVRILDEPTEGLDPSKRGEVLDILAEDAQTGTTILLSSHHLQEVDRACDRLIFINRGTIIADENSAELRRRAKRLVKLSFDPECDSVEIETGLKKLDQGKVTLFDQSFNCLLPTEDPRAFFTALSQSGLPAPATIDYGTPSLNDLYRELYGVEGV